MLCTLIHAVGAPCTREQLSGDMRDRNFDHSDRSVDMHITALRRKLGDDPRHARYIRTVRAVGYQWIHTDDHTDSTYLVLDK
jgi:DNA-binding response OmpR family regulator